MRIQRISNSINAIYIHCFVIIVFTPGPIHNHNFHSSELYQNDCIINFYVHSKFYHFERYQSKLHLKQKLWSQIFVVTVTETEQLNKQTVCRYLIIFPSFKTGCNLHLDWNLTITVLFFSKSLSLTLNSFARYSF